MRSATNKQTAHIRAWLSSPDVKRRRIYARLERDGRLGARSLQQFVQLEIGFGPARLERLKREAAKYGYVSDSEPVAISNGPIWSSLRQWLTDENVRPGISHKGICRLAGVHIDTISRWLNKDEEPNPIVFRELTRAAERMGFRQYGAIAGEPDTGFYQYQTSYSN